jgi:hypothetical protein
MTNNKFSAFIPVELIKAKDKEGKEIKKLRGVASTPDVDSDGEMLMPSGFDLSTFLEKGVFNWHHQQKGKPMAIIGEPTMAKIINKGQALEVECELYDTPLANEVYELAGLLEKSSKTRRLGFSIEGSAIERDEKNPKIIRKANITGCAITYMPKNSKTWAEIVKADNSEFEKAEFENELKSFEGSETIFSEIIKSLQPFEEIEKSLDVVQDLEVRNPLIPESLEGSKSKELNKGEIIVRISKRYSGINKPELIKIKNFVEKFSNMKGNSPITDDILEKAFNQLDSLIEKTVNKDEDSKYKFDKKTQTYMRGGVSYVKNEDGEFEEVEDEDDEDKEETEKSIANDFDDKENDIQKAVEILCGENRKAFGAFSVILKSVIDDLQKSNDTNIELSEMVETLKGQFEDYLDAPQNNGRRSFKGTKAIEKAFGGSFGEQKKNDSIVLNKVNNREAILDVLDKRAFSKGYNEDFAKALTVFESSSYLPTQIIESLEKDGILIQ